MQPVTISVSSKNRSLTEQCVVEINLETIKINDDSFEYCVGYNFKGAKLFEYRKDCVNIHYFPS